MNPPNRHFRRLAPLLAMIAALLFAAGLTSSIAQARMERPANVPTVEQAQHRVSEATVELADVTDRIAALEADELDVLAQRSSLDVQQQQTLDLLQRSSRDAREFMLTAFIGGGDLADPDLLLGSPSAADTTWRWYLVSDRAALSHRAVARYEALRLSSDTAVVDLANRADEVEAELRSLRSQVQPLEGHLANEQQWLLIAQAWAESERAVAGGRYGEAPQANWDRLRFCESSDNYQAVSPSGIYRGAYQFDRATWRTVGGTGDPAAAPPLEQDARARILYARRGKSTTWPVCGRYLP